MMQDSKNTNPLGRIKQIGKRAEQLLFEPQSTVVDASDRLRAYVTAVLLLMLSLGFLMAVVLVYLRSQELDGSVLFDWRFFAVGLIVVLIGYSLSRTKYFSWGLGLALLPTLLSSFGTLLDSTANPDSILTFHQWMILPMLLGGVLFSRPVYRALVVLLVVPPIVHVFTLPAEFTRSAITSVFFLIINSILIGLATNFSSRLQSQAVAEVQAKNLAEKESIIQQLQQAETLQQQRAKVIEASYDINSKLSTILEPQRLVNETVNQIQTLFNYNYVQFYLLDEAGEKLTLAGGTGHAGQELFSRGHALTVEKGLVGQAAATNAHVLVEDVSLMEKWVANPLLPNTQSELAVPVALGDRVFGVLDVQEDHKDAFSAEDVALLQAVATAAALSLQNARLYEQAQHSARQEATLNQISQQVLAAPNMERVLQIAAQGLGSNLNVRKATVQLTRRVSNGRSQEKN